LVIDVLVSTGLAFAYSYKKSDLWKINMEKYIEIFPKDQQAIRALQKHDYKFDVQKMLKNRMKSFDQGDTDNTFLFIWYKLSTAIEESKLQSILEKISYASDSKKIKLEFSTSDIKEINKLKAIISKYDLDIKEYIKDKTKYLLVGKKI
jgi:type II secretory pathway component PulL